MPVKMTECHALTLEILFMSLFWFGQGVSWGGHSVFYVFYVCVYGRVWFSNRGSCLSLSLIENHT
jgi:hypothetical protein